MAGCQRNVYPSIRRHYTIPNREIHRKGIAKDRRNEWAGRIREWAGGKAWKEAGTGRCRQAVGGEVSERAGRAGWPRIAAAS